jgi:hypothetical protein
MSVSELKKDLIRCTKLLKHDLANARRALCPPDKLVPFSPIYDISPLAIADMSTSRAHACITSSYLHKFGEYVMLIENRTVNSMEYECIQ